MRRQRRSPPTKNLDNRSAFMRECLRRWNALETSTHIHPTSTPKCYPSSKAGLCQICWPDGPPPHEAWLYYRGTGGVHSVQDGRDKWGSPRYREEFHDYPTEWIEEQAREHATPQFSIEGIEPSRPPPEPLPWWRRMISGFRKKSRR